VAVPSFGELWKLARAVDALVSLEKRSSDSFDGIARRLEAIEGRLTRIEADRERVVTEAKAAAATAASVAASAHLAGLAHTMGGLEERVRQLVAPALPAPSGAKRKRPKG